MPGRGDNNKHGSAGRGSSNQSNQAFVHTPEKEPASNHNKYTNGSKTLNIMVDKVPYIVTISPFTFNEENRYYVQVSGEGEQHVFAWDMEASQWRAIDDDASILSSAVEQAISSEIISMQR